MKAIFVTGGKQYYVSEGDVIYVEKLEVEAGKDIEFTDVLMVGEKVGTPTVSGAKVVCTAEKNGKAKKVVVFKYHPKKKSCRDPSSSPYPWLRSIASHTSCRNC